MIDTHPLKRARLAIALAALVAALGLPGAASGVATTPEADLSSYFVGGPCDDAFCEKCIALTVAYCAAYGAGNPSWECTHHGNGTCSCNGRCTPDVNAAVRIGGIL